jgi:hypothetical protein
MGVHGDHVGGEVQDPIQDPRAGADDPARDGVPQLLVPAAAPAAAAPGFMAAATRSSGT